MIPVMIRMSPRTRDVFKVAAKVRKQSLSEFMREASWKEIGPAKAKGRV